ncbi:serine/threonine-protein kinase 36 isoform X2 [Eurytemora carolleeae]|uniref:serine/threonine-protein kinase 36 isoform X1 n=1 Tax=Eurytemora carolleeae TaxID=1294199 RepID=UPI000C75A547|nr:serine/threonine-protein kinase 36 isoform X1 [Eurytemora carolleeae]XP_023331894.1 serine/threonine-protein kinase 36 isoform X2 [Eurytemora carolleeae]|eukprot:XP_023331893.1 serine/threonine-protein kinase 36-like isoform X1 [Eurytemora affinis]
MDRFKVIEMIGEGSFGRVFKAVERDTGQTVALKLIPKVGHSEKEISSLRSEFKIQKELSHPNIVRMLDAFETEKELISVAEFIPGELYRLFDLYKLEMGYRRLPEERVQEICGDLLSALHYLHSHRILHRDIKPQNILLDSNGRAKLCDFGFARNLGVHTLVLTSIKGTPLYMAPELIEEKPYDHTADIWSLGCIVYELLTGYPPFSTSSLFQLIKKIRYESIQWPAHLSVESRSFLQGVLEKESRKRLNWPELALHPFVKDRVCILAGSESAPLTSNLSESQELAKEIQRQDKAKLLPGNSQTLIRYLILSFSLSKIRINEN